jgi:hypothetical protein
LSGARRRAAAVIEVSYFGTHFRGATVYTGTYSGGIIVCPEYQTYNDYESYKTTYQFIHLSISPLASCTDDFGFQVAATLVETVTDPIRIVKNPEDKSYDDNCCYQTSN